MIVPLYGSCYPSLRAICTLSQYFSQEGLEKLKKELEERKGPIRVEINRRILAAKELGDLSENAEFTEAKEDQAFNQGRIVEIEEILKEAQVVQGKPGAGGTVEVGSTVVVSSLRGEQTFSIVGLSESDPSKGFISNESPIGSGLMSHRVGDSVQIKTPSGVMEYTIKDIR